MIFFKVSYVKLYSIILSRNSIDLHKSGARVFKVTICIDYKVIFYGIFYFTFSGIIKGPVAQNSPKISKTDVGQALVQPSSTRIAIFYRKRNNHRFRLSEILVVEITLRISHTA